MPTFKHPCPHCGSYISRDVVACPACGRTDPFVPGRCGNCAAPIEDASWVACPKCGQPVDAAASAADAAADAAASKNAQADTEKPDARVDAPAQASPGACPACGGPLVTGAGFCRDCGTPVA